MGHIQSSCMRGRSGGWSEPWKCPAAQSRRRELHWHPAADRIKSSHQVHPPKMKIQYCSRSQCSSLLRLWGAGDFQGSLQRTALAPCRCHEPSLPDCLLDGFVNAGTGATPTSKRLTLPHEYGCIQGAQATSLAATRCRCFPEW